MTCRRPFRSSVAERPSWVTRFWTAKEAVAKAAGTGVGSVISIQENAGEGPRPMFAARGLAGMAAPTPTAAGEMNVTANVTVTFELK